MAACGFELGDGSVIDLAGSHYTDLISLPHFRRNVNYIHSHGFIENRNLGSVQMFKSLLLVGVASIGLTAGALIAAAGPSAETPVEVSLNAKPVFPTAATKAAKAPAVAPAGAQYRIRSGKSGFRFVACNEQRAFTGGAIEFHCLSWSPKKGWGKSLRWIGKHSLLPLTGDAPAEPVVTAIR